MKDFIFLFACVSVPVFLFAIMSELYDIKTHLRRLADLAESKERATGVMQAPIVTKGPDLTPFTGEIPAFLRGGAK